MLVLSRKLGERIHIGDGIEVQVVAIQGGRVKLGIRCPRDIPILRAELVPSGMDRTAFSGSLPADGTRESLSSAGVGAA